MNTAYSFHNMHVKRAIWAHKWFENIIIETGRQFIWVSLLPPFTPSASSTGRRSIFVQLHGGIIDMP